MRNIMLPVLAWGSPKQHVATFFELSIHYNVYRTTITIKTKSVPAKLSITCRFSHWIPTGTTSFYVFCWKICLEFGL